ncbi:MAG: twin-arginine translocase TatA/TatE family subunit [Actinomycetota bacterium]|nr:twin-arginine translocase TatA/TatE family subunit [Actinomycetota bacterium]
MPINVGPMELIIVLVIALIVLGPKRLPEAGRAVGKGLKEFKDSLSGNSPDDDDDGREPPAIRAESSDRADEKPAESPFAQR